MASRHGRRNYRAIRLVCYGLALALGAWVLLAAKYGEPPNLATFLAVMLLPPFGAFCLPMRPVSCIAIAAATYAALAGLREVVAAAGDTTLINQLSSAAIVTLFVAALFRLGEMLRPKPIAPSSTPKD